LKSVKFKKVDQPFLREARAENEGEIEGFIDTPK
jgi:hypothetical protein